MKLSLPPKAVIHTLIAVVGATAAEFLNDLDVFPETARGVIKLVCRLALAYLSLLNLWRNPDASSASQSYAPDSRE